MPFKSKAQQRWMYAAEERGEVPKGTAKRWSDETENIKGLPEHKKKDKKMKKEGMFFDGGEPSSDGMFYKRAQEEAKKPAEVKLDMDKRLKGGGADAPKDPTKIPTPKPLPVTPPPPDKPKPPEDFGCGSKKVAFMNYPGIGLGGPPNFGSQSNASTNAETSMGTGKKVKGQEKKAALPSKEQVLGEGEKTVRSVGEGAARAGMGALKSVQDAPDWAKALMVGAPSYMLLRRARKAVARAASRGAGEGALAKFMTYARKLRGR